MKYLFILFLLPFYVSATNISGKVTDENNKPLPFVTVYLKGTSTGTTSNSEGLFSFSITPGEYVLEFRFISYKIHSENISVKNEPLVINVQLFPEAIQTKEVVVYANAEDPAYAIIRKAQKKRKYYLHEVQSYSCDAYTKMIQKLTKHPTKIFGQEVDLSDVLDTATGIVYLSETVSKLAFMQPDKIKEEIISSKVSGNNSTFSFNAAQNLLFNFYENLLPIEGLSPRGFVSPIATSAMLYYTYHLEGTYIENGETINKIKVTPKRKSDPAFSGYIYIMEDSWRIHSVDLTLTKDAQMEFIDTLTFHQVYLPVEKSRNDAGSSGGNVWLPFNSSFTFVFGVFGFKGNGSFLGINSNYKINPDFPKGYFNNEVLKIDKDANKKDSAYWNTERPVPLTMEEDRDYVKRDSTTAIHESKPYKDSVDRKRNTFHVGDLFTGYTHNNSFTHRSYSFSSALAGIQFNTVEGVNLDMNFNYIKRKSDEDEGSFSIFTQARYGFSNRHFNPTFGIYKLYDPLKRAAYSISAGSTIAQFNDHFPITEFVNSLYSLLAERNYMKIYEKQFLHITHTFEVVNGFTLFTEAEYADRLPLTNTSPLSWVNIKNRDYTSNDPLNPATDLFHFQRNQSLTFDASAVIRFSQEYMTRPDGKFNLPSKYPRIYLFYKKGFKDLAGSDVNYDFASAGIRDNIIFGLFGKLRYSISYGGFLNRKDLQFMDAKHFNGNRTFLSTFDLNKFNLLDYYAYSTTDPYFEGHAEHNFGGFFLNKIPLIRKLKLSEVVSFHFLHTSVLDRYMELSVGIEKLNLIRIDFSTAFSDGKNMRTGFLFGLRRRF